MDGGNTVNKPLIRHRTDAESHYEELKKNVDIGHELCVKKKGPSNKERCLGSRLGKQTFGLNPFFMVFILAANPPEWYVCM